MLCGCGNVDRIISVTAKKKIATKKNRIENAKRLNKGP